ncbi:MAG: THUMP domain-containing protein, partial [Candidatus Nanoarchaeia archaeon]
IVNSQGNCEVLKNVFGITSISPATKTEYDKIAETAIKYYTKGSFKISTQRITKEGIESSHHINVRIGDYIVNKTGAKVKLNNPDVEIGIEIINDYAYVFNKKIKAVGGLPIGCEGKVAVLLEDKDSIKAAYMMMRRGCKIILVEKKKVRYEELKKYAYGTKIELVKEIPQDAIAVVTSEKLNKLKKRSFKQVVIRPLL